MATHRLVGRANPASFHLHSVWRERAKDTDLPLWLRVAALAYGRHKVNGHATFTPGELVDELGKPKDMVYRAIATAKEKGWLSRQSTARCLVVPPHAITGGCDGGPHDPCPVHG